MRALSIRTAALLAAALLLGPPAAPAATITVTTAVDEDNGNAMAPASQGCSLREALQAVFNNDGNPYKGCSAATVGGPNTIDIQVAGPIVVNGLVPDPGNPMATKRNGLLPNVSMSGGPLIIQGSASSKISCDASPNGQKIFVMTSGSDLTLTSLAIQDCTASGAGIAITNTGGDLTINTVTFSNVHSDSGGVGAVINHTGGSLNLNVVNFLNNGTSDVANPMAETGDGGAIALGTVSLPDVVNMNTVTFTGNTAANSGGAIYWTNSDSTGHLFTITNGTFTMNTAKGSSAEDGGGAIWAQTDLDSTDVFQITNTQFILNEAEKGVGGAIALSGAQLAWIDPLLPLAGGIVGSNFFQNKAGGDATSDATGGSGGAIYARGNLTVVQSSFKDNVSTKGSGGAILLRNPSSSFRPLSIVNTTFNGNTADQAGGAIANVHVSENGALDLRNVTLAGNGAMGNTAAGNTIAGGGELYNNNDNANPAFPRVVVANTILAASTNGTPCAGVGFVDDGNNLQFPGSSCGPTIVTDDPMLMPATVHLTAANGVPAVNPFVLSMQPGPSSPALGAGSNAICSAGPVLTFDATGIPFRPFGDASCDIGALEGAASVPEADLAITKTDGTASATPGGSTTYTIVATNNGPDGVMGATVADTFPAACTSVSWSCSAAGGASCAANGNGNINDTVNLPAGGSATYLAQCTLSAAATGSLVNTATVSSSASDSTPGNDSATDTDTLTPAADLAITKSDGTTQATPGGSTTYTIVATNAGPSNVGSATVADSFPAACTTVSWTCMAAGGASCAANGNGNINDTVSLPAGGSVTYLAQCAIAAGATGTLSNTATVSSGVSDPVPGNNSATDDDALGTSSTTTSLMSSQNPSTAGQTVTFTATVSAMSGTPTGSVDFLDGVVVIGNDVALVAGQATLMTSALAVGSHPITASYSGDASYDPSTSGVVDQMVQPTLSVGDLTLAEGNSGTTMFGFPVTLSAASPGEVVVSYATADGTATVADSDYAAASGLLTFSAGQTNRTITVLVSGDTRFENSEGFVLNLSAPSGAAILDGQAGGTITNDDSQPQISVSDVTAAEGNSGTTPFGFMVTLSNPSFQMVSVDFATADGSAMVANADYAANSGTLQFSPGQTSLPVTVLVGGDTTPEPNEAFVLNLSAPANGSLLDGQGTGTITNDDTVPAMSIGDVTLAEGNSGTTMFVFPVSLSVASGQQITVNFASANGTATTADLDYAAASGILTFAPGQTNRTISVQVNGDAKFESDETFAVNLSGPANATILDGAATGTITNDDPQPTLSIGDVTLAEGDSGTTAFDFAVSLSAASSQQITVNFATANGTATTADLDYAAASGILTFAPGQTNRTLTVQVNGDAKFEGDETFAVNLSGPVNATILDGAGTGTITNDDTQPTLSIGDASGPEGNASPGTLTFTVSLSGASAQEVTVAFATADGTATVADLDYAPASGLLTFAPGQTSRTASVTIYADLKAEPDEAFSVNLSAPLNATLQDGQGAGTLLNDDGQPTLRPADVVRTEGNGGLTAFTFGMTLSNPSAQQITVNYATADGAPGSAPSAAPSLSVAPDGSFVHATVPGAAAVLAFAVDPQSGELSAAADQAAGEAPTATAFDGQARHAYVARATGAVSLHAVDGPAGMLRPLPGPGLSGVGSIVPRPDGAFVYAASATLGEVMVHAVEAETGLLQPASSVKLPWLASMLTADPAGRFLYALHPAQSRVSVLAIDPVTGALQPVAGSPFDASRGPVALAADPTGIFVWVLTRGGDVLGYRVDPGSGALQPRASVASAGPARALAVDSSGSFLYVAHPKRNDLSAFRIDRESGDLLPVPGSPFPAGSQPAALAVHPSGRFLYEVDEASRQISAFAIDTATGSLTRLPGAPYQTLATAPATAGEDYVATSGTLTFAPGATSASAVVNVQGDFKFEPDEAFRLVLSAPVGASLLRTEALGLVLDDERGRISSPAPGATLTSNTATFTWSPASLASHYWLEIGTTPGGADLYSSRQDGLSATVTGLPVNGVPLYVRLWTFVPAPVGYVFVDATYTAFTATLAQITSPANGSTLPAGPVTFQWTPGTGINRYWLEIGSVPGGTDLYTQDQGASLSATVNSLPRDGRTVHVRLWSFVIGRTGWRYVDFQYVADLAPGSPLAAR